MAPPFIAYFGALQGGDGETNLLQIAYEQCSLYRDGLRDEGGLWRHVAEGSWQDNTYVLQYLNDSFLITPRPDTGLQVYKADLLYITVAYRVYRIPGNGWAAAGMLRVLETLNHSSQAQNFVDHRTNLTSWIEEIIAAAWQHQVGVPCSSV